MFGFDVTGSKAFGAVLQEVSRGQKFGAHFFLCPSILFAPSGGVTSGVGQPSGTVVSRVLAFWFAPSVGVTSGVASWVVSQVWYHKWCHKLAPHVALKTTVQSP